MVNVLKISFPEKCIGCELCVFAIQRQFNRAGLEGSLIRVFRNSTVDLSASTEESALIYTIELDPHINKYDIEKIKNICPTGVFTIEESEGEYDLLH